MTARYLNLRDVLGNPVHWIEIDDAKFVKLAAAQTVVVWNNVLFTYAGRGTHPDYDAEYLEFHRADKMEMQQKDADHAE